MVKLFILLLVFLPISVNAQACTSWEDFVNGKADVDPSKPLCDLMLETTDQFCRPEPLTQGEAYLLRVHHPLESIHAFGLHGLLDDVGKILAADLIRFRVALSEYEALSNKDIEFLLDLSSLHYSKVLSNAAPQSASITAIANMNAVNFPGKSYYPPDIYVSGPPRQSEELEQHLKCAVQCFVENVPLSEMILQDPLRQCVGAKFPE